MTCKNCNAAIGCSCVGKAAYRKASDGKVVCTKCIRSYEASIKNIK